MDIHAAQNRPRQINLIVIYIFGYIRFRDSAVNQRRIKVCLQQRQRFHVVILQLAHVLFLRALLVERFAESFEALRQLLRVNRLQQVFLHLQMHGFLRVFKLVKTGAKKNPDRRILVLQTSRQLQPVHVRHLDIRHHDVRLAFLCHFQREHPVARVPGDCKSQTLPVNLIHNHADRFFFVIHKQNTVRHALILPAKHHTPIVPFRRILENPKNKKELRSVRSS